MFLPDAEGAHRLVSLELIGANADGSSLCATLARQVGQVDSATDCHGARGDTGDLGEGSYRYCLGSPDGTEEISVNCRPSRQGGDLLEYRMW